jgi:peptidoglycan/LPS O-acetylase OafA/YrhL
VPDLTTEEYPREFRPDIQAMRALAVGLVVLYHADIPGVHWGLLGVDVFFVISGYVITNVLLRETATRNRASISGFYARRIRRILPAATVVIIVTIFATYHWLASIDGAYVANDAKWVAAFLGNFHFAAVGTNYFTQSLAPSPLQQFWSLGVEEQFYVVWPLLFVALAWKRLWFTPRIRLGAALVAIIAASLTWCIIETGQNSTWAFFSPFTRAWELGLGALIAVLGPWFRSRPKNFAVVGLIMQFVGVAAIVACTWFYYAPAWPGTAVIIPVAATGVVIIGGSLRGPDSFGRFTKFTPIQWLGDTSYSLYLVHWPVIAIATQFVFYTGPSATVHLSLLSDIGLIAISLVLTAVLHYCVENPLRRWQWLVTHKVATYVMGALLIALTYGAIYWHLHNFGQ